VTVPKAPVVATAAVAVAFQVVALARNATAAVKLGTLLARVPRLLLPTLGMAAAEATVVVLAAAAEVKLGTYPSHSSNLVSCLTVFSATRVAG